MNLDDFKCKFINFAAIKLPACPYGNFPFRKWHCSIIIINRSQATTELHLGFLQIHNCEGALESIFHWALEENCK